MDDEQRTAASGRLAALADQVEHALGAAATVMRSADAVGGRNVAITPTRPDAVGIVWMEWGQEVVVETSGGPGGRWELEMTDHDLDLLTTILDAVVAGRVTEQRRRGRSRVEVILADGRRLTRTGIDGAPGLWPGRYREERRDAAYVDDPPSFGARR